MGKWAVTALALALLVAVGESATIAGSDSVVDYSGYRVLGFHLRNQQEVKYLENLREKYELDFWRSPRTDGAVTDVMVGPKFYEAFTGFLDQLGIPYAIKIDNVQRLIDTEAIWNKRGSLRFDGSFDHTAYHTYEEIMAILDNLEKSHPDLVSSYIAGTTYESRSSRVVKVSTGGDPKPAIWIDCGIHAREWVSTATCQYILDKLTSDYGTDQDVTNILDTHDFHILPLANPDGYNFSWEKNRIWRKNRHPFPNNFITCYGADPNRNFDSDFGGPGTSSVACSDIYHGEYAFSEVESQAIRDSVTKLGDNVKAFFTLHSFSQFWMVPYGYTHDLPPNYADQLSVAQAGADALSQVYGTQYSVGNIADIVYLAAGGSTDWAYDKAGIQQAHALELRDTGNYGFFLPPEFILPTADEVWVGIMAAVNAI